MPFAAADDALGGYRLSTFLEEPQSGALAIISSTIQGIDLYFNRCDRAKVRNKSESQKHTEIIVTAAARSSQLTPAVEDPLN